MLSDLVEGGELDRAEPVPDLPPTRGTRARGSGNGRPIEDGHGGQ